jgi:hypothetical protein
VDQEEEEVRGAQQSMQFSDSQMRKVLGKGDGRGGQLSGNFLEAL